MTIKNLFIFGAIVALFFGLLLVVAPEALAKQVFINPTLSDTALAVSRNYGIVLFSVGVAVFLARNSVPSAARRGFIVQMTLSGLLLCAIDVYNIISGLNKSAAWGVAIITGILGIWGLLALTRESKA